MDKAAAQASFPSQIANLVLAWSLSRANCGAFVSLGGCRLTCQLKRVLEDKQDAGE